MNRSGLTLVETCALVAVFGSVVAVFVPTLMREVETSKLTEPASMLNELFMRTASYYEARHKDTLGTNQTHCVVASAGPTPAFPSATPQHVNFFSPSTTGQATWQSLGFNPKRDLRFSYSLVTSIAGCAVEAPVQGRVLTLEARGDLDQDRMQSLFQINVTLNSDHVLKRDGYLRVKNRVE